MGVALVRSLTVAAVVFGVSVSLATAQSRGRVAGSVSSIDGARLPHASIVLIDESSGREFRSSSDDLGGFVLDRVPTGRYVLVVEFPGLSPRTLSNVVVADTGNASLDVVLDVPLVRETVAVSPAVPRGSVEMTQVRESPARDVGELLADSPGLWKLRKGGIASDVVLRGLQSRDLNVLIDGERLYGACPNHMDPPAFHVDFSQVERIDVGKGPFDVRYQGSLGGIVNVVTRRPDAGWHATPSVTVGSFGFVNPAATVSYGSGTMSALAGGSFRQSRPYVDGHGNAMTTGAGYRPGSAESDAFRAGTMWGRFAWRPVLGHQVEASYTRQRTDHLLYPYLLMDAIYDNADRAALEYVGPGIGRRVSGLRAQVYWSGVDHWMTDEYRLSSAGAVRAYSMGTDATTMTAGGRVDATVGRTTVGGEAFRRNWNTETRMAGMAYSPQYAVPDVNIDVVGVFAEHARPVAKRVSIDLGGRLDRVASSADPAKAATALYAAYHGATAVARTDVLPSGRAKAVYRVGDYLEVSGGVGHTARVAEGNERFYGLRRMGTDWVGNPGLAPTRNTGVDLSVSVRHPGVTLSANGYVHAVHDYIAVRAVTRRLPVAGVINASARSYANVDAMLRGLEASASVTVRAPLSVSGDLSYVRGTMAPDAGSGIVSRDLAEMPPLRARLRVRLDNGRLFGELEGVGSAAQDAVDRSLGEATTPSYAIANLSAGFRQGPFAVTAGVANLFDRYFVEHLSYQRDPFRSGMRVAEPGRNVFTTVTWRF